MSLGKHKKISPHLNPSDKAVSITLLFVFFIAAAVSENAL